MYPPLPFSFFADVANKPGWITKARKGKRLQTRVQRLLGFKVILGPRRRVVITHLRTYGDGLGTAMCSIGCKPDDLNCPSTLVKTKWAQHASQVSRVGVASMLLLGNVRSKDCGFFYRLATSHLG